MSQTTVSETAELRICFANSSASWTVRSRWGMIHRELQLFPLTGFIYCTSNHLSQKLGRRQTMADHSRSTIRQHKTGGCRVLKAIIHYHMTWSDISIGILHAEHTRPKFNSKGPHKRTCRLNTHVCSDKNVLPFFPISWHADSVERRVLQRVDCPQSLHYSRKEMRDQQQAVPIRSGGRFTGILG